ncbi:MULTISPECIES: aldo/keto reductase [unclassified Enterococcus]|uniref:aldo/keto reductase n=1 Tax=unclassified Enterococcus TaxID=2608891 RepID=UPI001CE02BD5|nr:MULTISPECIES: aldo/keto reductase [unclassified Enterococcus]MCA5013675.1 aldo/keto reductase [Enterococcus sp. S23]MCA5016925.1 aldo/keto reductase [Enterococcus sp. S22(2020)]
MEKVLLGSTGEKVSVFCLGCMNFGTKINEVDSFALLDKYVERGGDFLDTSNNYAFWNEGGKGGESEAVIGKWMQQRKNRKQLFLATKIGALPKTIGAGFEDIEGLSRNAIIRAVEASLQRLHTDYLDLCYAHIDDKMTSLKETLEAFSYLIRTKKIRFIGCSNYTYERLKEANEISQSFDLERYCCIQNRYSYLQPKKEADFGVQKVLTQEIIDYAERESITLLAYSPLLHGFYNDKKELKEAYVTEANRNRMSILLEISEELKIEPNQLVLAWMLKKSSKVLPLIGVSNLLQLENNLDALTISIDNEQMNRLSFLK